MIDRYVRQISIEQIGEQGQENLRQASVIVVGAGGLGSPALTYLMTAGIGKISLIDNDVVDISNLNRQFLYGENDIGLKKSAVAVEKLSTLNSSTALCGLDIRLTDENAASILQGYDLVLGAVDSFSTRTTITKACAMLKIPYIDGGLNGFSGSVAFSFPPDAPCLNCIFPVYSSSQPIGVIGTTAGFIGASMANIALLNLLGLDNPLVGKLFLYDGLRMQTNLLTVSRKDDCQTCKL